MNKDADSEIKNYWSKLLIFLLIIGVGYLTYYKFFIFDKKNDNKQDNNVVEKKDENSNKKEENSNKKDENTNIDYSNVPVEDTFAINIENSGIGDNNILIMNFILKDGYLYKYSKDDIIEEYFFRHANYLNNKDFIMKKVEGLSNIKRIKGSISVGTDASIGLLLITNDGDVLIYYYRSPGQDGDISKAPYLEEYQVEDIIDYSFVPGCTHDGTPNFKTCGGYYHIITKDGKEYNYTVKTDGTLENR